MLSSIPPIQDDKEDVLCDVESLFANILIKVTINCITEKNLRSAKVDTNLFKIDFQKFFGKNCYRMKF